MSTSNKIQNLNKINNAIFLSLSKRNVQFTRFEILNISDEETILKILEDELLALKELDKSTKPQIEKKVKQIPVVLEKKKTTEIKSCNENDEDEDESFENPKISFSTISSNFEELKRLFFNSEYEKFEELMVSNENKLLCYNVNYKYSSDKDGQPEFIAKNLLNGFVKKIEGFEKYFLICFRCFKHEATYDYPSLWIVNTSDPIFNVIDLTDFDFEQIKHNNLQMFLENLKKKIINCENLIGEKYAH
jgi:hypothetical protein